MNEQEYMDYLEERFLQLADENGIQYEKVAPGEGKVIIKENDVIIGELGEAYPTEEVLKMLVKESEPSILYNKIEYSQFFSFTDSEDGYIIESDYLLNDSNLKFEDLLKEIEIKKLVIKGTPKVETPLVTIPNERVSYDVCSSQTLMEAS